MTNKPKFEIGDYVSIWLEYENAVVREVFNDKEPYFYKVLIGGSRESSVQEEFLDHAET